MQEPKKCMQIKRAHRTCIRTYAMRCSPDTKTSLNRAHLSCFYVFLPNDRLELCLLCERLGLLDLDLERRPLLAALAPLPCRAAFLAARGELNSRSADSVLALRKGACCACEGDDPRECGLDVVGIIVAIRGGVPFETPSGSPCSSSLVSPPYQNNMRRWHQQCNMTRCTESSY